MPLILGIQAISLGWGSDRVTGTLMSPSLILLLMYCGLIALSSLSGGVLPMLIRLTHTRMQLLVSLIGGLMLGVGIFHQLPHAVAAMPEIKGAPALDRCMGWLMLGLLLTFFMLRMFHFHSHEPVEADGEHSHDCGHDHDHDHAGHHDHDHDHGHVHQHGHADLLATPKRGSWIGIFLGLSLHTLLDGVALAAHVEADALHEHGGFTLLGLGTFLGVVLHKPLDSLSITSLMATGGWSRQSMRLVNIGYALMCPLGAAIFYLGTQSGGVTREVVVAAALAMSAGVFICISLSDLLPEVQFHSHDRLWLSAALLLGVAVAWLIGFVEPEHTHNHSNPAAVQDHRH